MWAAFQKDGCMLVRRWAQPREIFADEKATAAMLRFIRCTSIGRKCNADTEELSDSHRRINISIADLDEQEESE